MPKIPQADRTISVLTGPAVPTQAPGPNVLPNSSRAIDNVAATLQASAEKLKAMEDRKRREQEQRAILLESSNLSRWIAERQIHYRDNPRENLLDEARGEYDAYINEVAGRLPTSQAQQEFMNRADQLAGPYFHNAHSLERMALADAHRAGFDEIVSNAQDILFKSPTLDDLASQQAMVSQYVERGLMAGRIDEEAAAEAIREKSAGLAIAWAQSAMADDPELVLEHLGSELFDGVPVAARATLKRQAEAAISSQSQLDREALKERFDSEEKLRLRDGVGNEWDHQAAVEAFGETRANEMQRQLARAETLHGVGQGMTGASGEKLTDIGRAHLPQSPSFKVAKVTHYWPGPKKDAAKHGLKGSMEGGMKDRHGNDIWGQSTLEDYFEGKGPGYVTVAMDRNSPMQGRYLASPAFPGVVFRVMDTGEAGDGKGNSWVDVATRTPEKAAKLTKHNLTFTPISEQQAIEIAAHRNDPNFQLPEPLTDEQIGLAEDVATMIERGREIKRADPFTWYRSDPALESLAKSLNFAMAATLPADPPPGAEVFRNLLLQRQREDTDLGPDDVAVMPQPVAEQLVQRFNDAATVNPEKGSNETLQGLVLEFSNQFGRHSDVALRQLAKVKGSGAEVASKIEPLLWHKDDPAIFHQIATSIRVDESTVKKGFEERNPKKISFSEFEEDVRLNNDLIKYRASLLGGDPFNDRNRALADGVEEVFRSFARERVLAGGTVDAAAQDFFSAYHYTEVGDESVIAIPAVLNGEIVTPAMAEQTGDYLHFEQLALAERIRKDEEDLAFSLDFGRNERLNDALAATMARPDWADRVADLIETQSFWLTNEQENGVYLMLNGEVFGAPVLVTMQGEAYEIPFAQTFRDHPTAPGALGRFIKDPVVKSLLDRPPSMRRF